MNLRQFNRQKKLFEQLGYKISVELGSGIINDIVTITHDYFTKPCRLSESLFSESSSERVMGMLLPL